MGSLNFVTYKALVLLSLVFLATSNPTYENQQPFSENFERNRLNAKFSPNADREKKFFFFPGGNIPFMPFFSSSTKPPIPPGEFSFVDEKLKNLEDQATNLKVMFYKGNNDLNKLNEKIGVLMATIMHLKNYYHMKPPKNYNTYHQPNKYPSYKPQYIYITLPPDVASTTKGPYYSIPPIYYPASPYYPYPTQPYTPYYPPTKSPTPIITTTTPGTTTTTPGTTTCITLTNGNLRQSGTTTTEINDCITTITTDSTTTTETSTFTDSTISTTTETSTFTDPSTMSTTVESTSDMSTVSTTEIPESTSMTPMPGP